MQMNVSPFGRAKLVVLRHACFERNIKQNNKRKIKNKNRKKGKYREIMHTYFVCMYIVEKNNKTIE